MNDHWNAEPNAPNAKAFRDGEDVVLEFDANYQKYKTFRAEQRLRLRFKNAWRYRFGAPNDEGWYSGQCRFSGVAPKWGEFYEVSGDLKIDQCPKDWLPVRDQPTGSMRHFLFYLRDDTFECDASDYKTEF